MNFFVPYNPVRSCIILYGPILSFTVLVGPVLACLEMFGHCLLLCGLPCSRLILYVSLYGPLLFPTVRYGHVQSYVVLIVF